MLLLLSFASVAIAAPPVPADEGAAVVYAYRGPEASGDYTVDEILALVRAAPAGLHEVRGGSDARDWTPWNRVPTLALAWLAPQGATVYRYWSGEREERLTAPEIAERVRAEPDAEHLVWKAGMTEWADARDVPTLRLALSGAPPPVPSTIAEVPAPAPAPSVAVPPPPAPPPPVAPPARVRVGGDVRIDLTAANLERLGGGTDGPATLGFNVSRARPVVDAEVGEWLSGRLAVEFRQDDTTTAYTNAGVTFDVKDWADGWSVQGREVWVQVGRIPDAPAGFHQRVRIGLQEPAYGVRDRYEEDYPFAGNLRADLARREGLVQEEDLGVGWRGVLGDRFAFDAQVLNGSGGARLDQNNGKDLVVRAAVAPVAAVNLSLSGLYGARGQDGTGEQAHASLAVEVKGANQRLLLVGIVGTTSEDRLDTVYSGAAASGVWSFPVAGAARSVDLVGRFQFYDPVAGLDQPDAWWAPAGGAWVVLDPYQGHDVRIGATWEMFVPQDSLLPVEHTAIAEAAWVF